MTRNPNHRNADDLMAVAVAIYAVADSCPGNTDDPDGLPQAFYAEADEAYDIAVAMGGKL